MSPSAIARTSTSSPTLDSTAKLTKAGTESILSQTQSHNNSRKIPAVAVVADLDASKCTVTRTASPKPVPALDSPEVLSQSCTTDHMLTARWTEAAGWEAPEIKPYGALSIMPTASVLHYATECFEGMKAYRGVDGKVRLFRPDRNAQRFLQSATRIALPGFSTAEFRKCLERFVGVEARRWLPASEHERFVYLRPTMIATAPALGVQRPKEALMYIIAVLFPRLDEPRTGLAAPTPDGTATSSAGPPRPAMNGTTTTTANNNDNNNNNKKGMRLLASRHDIIRAWPGGFGNAKVGANYGPSLIAQGEARARGYDQILWLFGDEAFVTEAGGSNFFVLWLNEDGERELVTAPLGDGTILEGVTRASVLDLVRARGDVKVVERKFTMHEIVRAADQGRLLEGFGAGTAFFIAPVSDVHFRGLDVVFPLGKGERADFAMGIKDELKSIMYGRVQHEWGVVVDEL
ncbi:hypothetical protein PV08_08418 [Exophiala spinifera]|uniref:Branched-chain-amino-acid aminotransferase n=1 Tax=Exophiala spinifera TaxID=91928 RepID=A0A0D1YDU3_9EURO|nr:uncharacterized protein PV08_08418 [Exophiala spinifera]KIW13231.1 hypothetical protein PV08_08418 [Exophiala spinifera]